MEPLFQVHTWNYKAFSYSYLPGAILAGPPKNHFLLFVYLPFPNLPGGRAKRSPGRLFYALSYISSLSQHDSLLFQSRISIFSLSLTKALRITNTSIHSRNAWELIGLHALPSDTFICWCHAFLHNKTSGISLSYTTTRSSRSGYGASARNAESETPHPYRMSHRTSRCYFRIFPDRKLPI